MAESLAGPSSETPPCGLGFLTTWRLCVKGRHPDRVRQAQAVLPCISSEVMEHHVYHTLFVEAITKFCPSSRRVEIDSASFWRVIRFWKHIWELKYLWPFWGNTVDNTHHGAYFPGHYFWVPGIAISQWGPCSSLLFIFSGYYSSQQTPFVCVNSEKTESTHFYNYYYVEPWGSLCLTFPVPSSALGLAFHSQEDHQIFL